MMHSLDVIIERNKKATSRALAHAYLDHEPQQAYRISESLRKDIDQEEFVRAMQEEV